MHSDNEFVLFEIEGGEFIGVRIGDIQYLTGNGEGSTVHVLTRSDEELVIDTVYPPETVELLINNCTFAPTDEEGLNDE